MRRATHLTLIMILLLPVAAKAQSGLRGQIFLPHGAPLQRVIRFSLRTDDGTFNETYFTDEQGRIGIPQQLGVPFTITVEGDGETYDTTVLYFDPGTAGRYIVIHLKPHTPKATSPPGVVNLSAVDQRVSPRAREAYESALKLLQAQQYEQALEPLKQAISLQKDYFHAYTDLGVLYMKLNKLEQAEAALRQAIKINESLYLPQLNLAVVYNKMGKYKESIELLSKLERNQPDLEQKTSAPLIEALIGARQWTQAEERLRKGLEMKDADAVDLKIKLGMVLMRQDKAAAAADVLREAVKAEPDNALAQFNLGAALLQDGRLDESEQALRRAYELKGAGMPGAQFLLGQVYFNKKDYQKSLEAFRAYLRDLPDAPNAAQVKEAIQKLEAALKKK
jgi:tetratricopeptide (TPR) repeat protein